MPMPPPKPSVEGPRDRAVRHEMDQILRALRVEGPQTPDALESLVGARFWDPGRFDRALTFVLADGLAVRMHDGRLAGS
ncbi:MAG TPA: hypothetical protein VFZ64_16580 [Nocardioidaceae bacterium]